MKKIFTFAIILSFFLTAAVTAAEKSEKEYIADLDASKDEQVIVTAADWLGKKEVKKAVKHLVILAEDQRVNVRLHAVMALGYLVDKKDDKSVAVINKLMLNDDSAEVRYAAVLSSIRVGSKKSVSTWEKVKESESDPFIKDLIKKYEKKIKGK